jgi:hypothetical protein
MPTILIQTVRPLSREGTRLPVGGRSYHFTPNRRGDYVAEVVDVDVDTVLSISAGYKIYPHQDEKSLPGAEVLPPPEEREPAPRAVPAAPKSMQAPLGRMKHEAKTE